MRVPHAVHRSCLPAAFSGSLKRFEQVGQIMTLGAEPGNFMIAASWQMFLGERLDVVFQVGYANQAKRIVGTGCLHR